MPKTKRKYGKMLGVMVSQEMFDELERLADYQLCPLSSIVRRALRDVLQEAAQSRDCNERRQVYAEAGE